MAGAVYQPVGIDADVALFLFFFQIVSVVGDWART